MEHKQTVNLQESLSAIRNIHPSDLVKSELIARGYGSSVSIFQQPESQFIEDVRDIMPPEEAKQAYAQAKRNYTMLTHMTAALNATYGSSSYRALNKRLTGKELPEGSMFENIPSYQEIFGNLDYCDCPHCKSIFGPAAYFVDLMRIIRKHILVETSPAAREKAVPLDSRRGDLLHLKLSCENTNAVKPYLEIATGILEQFLSQKQQERGKEEQGELYSQLVNSYYPDSLPFHLPIETLRIWMSRCETSLAEVLQAWGFSTEAVAAQWLGVTNDLFALLQKPLDESYLNRFYGEEALNIESCRSLPYLLSKLRITRQELQKVFLQDIGDEEPGRGALLHGLFINQGLPDSEFLRITEDTVENITADTLERLSRFLRLSKLFGVSYEEMDWLLKTAGADSLGNIPLASACELADFARRTSMDVYTAAALDGKLKDYGANPFVQVFGRTRAQLEELSQPGELERLLVFKLGCTVEGLRALREYLGQKNPLDVDAVFRHCKAARLLALPLEEYVLLLRIAFSGTACPFGTKTLKMLASLCTGTQFSVGELGYLVQLTPGPYARPDVTPEAFHQKVKLMQMTVTQECVKDKEALSDYVYAELAQLFGQSAQPLKILFGCILESGQLEAWPERLITCTEPAGLDEVILQLSRYLMLVKAGISVELIDCAVRYPDSFGLVDANKPSLKSLLDIEAYQNFMTVFQDHDKKLIKFISEYSQDPTSISALAEAAGWSEEQVALVLETRYPDGKKEKNVTTLIRDVAGCLELLKKLALDKAGLKKLLSCTQEKDYDTIKTAVKELCDPVWDSDMQGLLAGRKRDALLEPTLLRLGERYRDITDYNKLYKYFLIDVEMDEKTLISPVKEGINALQLYLQRCRMRLERGIREITIPESWWSWIMDYRMWEANRKIFVYPENYLLPSVRQSKTKLFRNVEDALQQSKITDSYIESQYVKYLDEYFELTQLKICGAYETVVDNLNVLYVFARTQQQPYSYYYCKRVSTLAWSEWEKVDTNIDTDSITPVFVFNRLHIFWSILQENTKVKVDGSDQINAGNQKAYNLQIKYTYLNLQGKWITPQTLSEDVVVYAQDDKASSKEIRDKAKALGVTAPDDSFKKLTLLRLNQHNLNGFLQKGEEYECLAVITGSFAQNLGEHTGALEKNATLDQEQEAFSKAINRMISNNNFEVQSYEEGYFSTGYFKIFNEDLEEEHFLHQNEFIVVDGYIPPKYSLMYTVLHDEIHRAVGVYLSQSILRDAALPTKGILPFENNTPSAQAPRLNEDSFVIYGPGGKVVISPELSKEIYEKLLKEDVINSENRADEKMLANRDLLSLLNDLLIDTEGVTRQAAAIQETLRKHRKAPGSGNLAADSFVVKMETGEPLIDEAFSERIFRRLDSFASIENDSREDEAQTVRCLRSILYEENGAAERNNQILEIQKILLKNIGAVYLFKKADKAQVIPVVNQPGKFIYDCGDEAFLVYPVYDDNGKYYPLNIQKTDRGVTVGIPVTAGAFVKLGFDLQKARDILGILKTARLINANGIVDRDACSRKTLDTILNKSVNQQALDQIYVMLLNLPLIPKTEFEKITGITADEICTKLQESEAKVLYPWMGDPTLFRIDLAMLEQKNSVLFHNTKGGVLKDQSVSEIFKKLQEAVSSVNFNYRINEDLPKQFTRQPFRQWKFAVQRLTNPMIKKLKRKLETGGVSSFLNRQTQSEPPVPIMPFDRLAPTANVIPPKARDGAQVDFEGLYAEYNWELFYHIPMLIAESFRANAMNEDSMHWYHYVFDPTRPRDDSIQKYYWNFIAFAESDEETMESILKDPSAIQAYNDSPFNPHAIARLRINAYGKYTIMQYINNIIQWGDSQFVLNTWESLTTATMMYVWARDLLGPKPQQVANFRRKEDSTYEEIEKKYAEDPQGLPQFIIEMEKKLQQLQKDHCWIPVSEEVPFNDIRAYFGVPENEQILLLWDIIDDRLFKLRNCLDINGAPRTTALFELPKDPAALVRAFAASGADAPSVLTKKPVLYPYRFSYMIEQAKALTAQLISLGNSVLSALEKSDAEALLLLTGGQEQTLLQMTTSIRENQLLEIASGIESLRVSRASAEIRLNFYQSNASEYMSAKEVASFATDSVAAAFQAVGGTMRFAAGIAYLVPQVGSPFAMKYGGAEIGSSLAGAAAGYDTLAGISSHVSHQMLTMAQYDRRRDEWELQKKQAEKELANLDEQIKASLIRQQSAQKELAIHKKTIEHKNEVLSYLKKKFTGSQLYQWLVGRLTSTLWQTYQLALELSLAAQDSYQYERDEAADFLKFDYWDSGRKGLLSGECLMLALEQMQQSYRKKNVRRLEIEKHISLLHDCPQALEALKAKGCCSFELSERLFARDYPGCYRRKITSISLSVPAVLPPYETLKATLKQTSSTILLKANEKGIDYLFHLTQEAPAADVVREASRHGEKIAVSRGIDDSGMFTLSFNDERYLPFEGTGVASNWILEMPPENNRFDLQTITDVIVTVRYTAQEDEKRGPGSFYDYVLGKLGQEAEQI